MQVPLDVERLLRALSFASVKHRKQRRKDADASPYINHPIAVSSVLATEGGIQDEELLIAGILHDTVEDTETTFEELAAEFGQTISALVRELTSDKALPKTERKLLQIEHARTASIGAKQLKIADKICNIRDITTSPPAQWTIEQRREYLDWAAKVVDGCRGVNQRLERTFDETILRARESIRKTH